MEPMIDSITASQELSPKLEYARAYQMRTINISLPIAEYLHQLLTVADDLADYAMGEAAPSQEAYNAGFNARLETLFSVITGDTVLADDE